MRPLPSSPMLTTYYESFWNSWACTGDKTKVEAMTWWPVAKITTSRAAAFWISCRGRMVHRSRQEFSLYIKAAKQVLDLPVWKDMNWCCKGESDRWWSMIYARRYWCILQRDCEMLTCGRISWDEQRLSYRHCKFPLLIHPRGSAQ